MVRTTHIKHEQSNASVMFFLKLPMLTLPNSFVIIEHVVVVVVVVVVDDRD